MRDSLLEQSEVLRPKRGTRQHNEVYPGCEVDSKGGAKDSKNEGLSVGGGDGSSATAPKNEVYPVVTLGLAPKRRFSRREISCPQAVGRADTGLKRGLPGLRT